MTRKPDPVDVYVGAKIRVRRRHMGLSQEQLASTLGITFQQVQKYERGANRVSASKLYGIAEALGAPPSFFFEGLAGEDKLAAPAADAVRQLAMAPFGPELAEIFIGLRPDMARSLMTIARAMDGAGLVKAAAGAHLAQVG